LIKNYEKVKIRNKNLKLIVNNKTPQLIETATKSNFEIELDCYNISTEELTYIDKYVMNPQFIYRKKIKVLDQTNKYIEAWAYILTNAQLINKITDQTAWKRVDAKTGLKYTSNSTCKMEII
jgi:hypothetical protein